MKKTKRPSRTLILLSLVTAAMALIGLSIGTIPFELVRSNLDSMSGDGSADTYTRYVHFKFQLAGYFLFSISLLSLAMQWRYRDQLGYQITLLAKLSRNDSRQLISRSVCFLRTHLTALIVIMLFATCLRLPYLSQPLRYDEAHTYTRYASKPPALIVTQYDEPNNHVFHSMLVRASTSLLGDQPAMVRFPALIAGILLAGLTYCLGTICSDVQVGRISAMLVAGMPELIFYSTNARGYTTTAVLFLLACLAAREAIGSRNSVAWILMAMTLSLSIWTVPTMVYGAIALFGWLCFQSIASRSANWRRLLGAGLATAVTVALLYTPIALSIGVDRLVAVGGSKPQVLGHVFSSIPGKVIDLYSWIFWGIPIWVQLMLLGSVVVSVVRFQKTSWLCIASVIPVVLVILLQRVIPPERTWCFALALLAILCADGIVKFSSLFSRERLSKYASEWVAYTAVGVVVVSVMMSDAIRKSDETGLFHEADAIVATLKVIVRPSEPIIVVTPASATIQYYSRHGRLSGNHFMPPGKEYTDDSSAVVVTSRAHRQSVDYVLNELELGELFDASSAIRVAEFKTADIYRVSAK